MELLGDRIACVDDRQRRIIRGIVSREQHRSLSVLNNVRSGTAKSAQKMLDKALFTATVSVVGLEGRLVLTKQQKEVCSTEAPRTVSR